MNAFDSARGVEAQGMAVLLPYLQEMSDGRVVVTSKGTLAKWLQESVGDVVLMDGEEFRAVEIKVERKKTGNVFLETWSNRNLERKADHANRGQTPGWTMKIRSDLLFYYFLDSDWLFSFDVFELKRWLFGNGEVLGAWGSGRYRELCQRRYTQMNDTWGLLAPIADLARDMPKGSISWTKVRQRVLVEEAA